MDPLTQGLLGAVASQAAFTKQLGRWAGLIGFVAGFAPDLDVIYVNPADPVHGFIYHRHITHAFAAIPLGGALVALAFVFIPRLRERRWWVVAAATLGWATHGLLDTCTSYGTQMLLPFSSKRLAWDILPIVDLFFTPVLLVGCASALWRRGPLPARIVLGIAGLYILCGVWMQARASSAQRAIAELRGHSIEHGRVMPAPGTLVLWRSIYIEDGVMYADGLRTPWLGTTLVKAGHSLPVATLQKRAEREKRVFKVFAWFSDGFVGELPGESPPVVADMRYSTSSHTFSPLWGIRYGEDGPENWSTEERGEYADRLLSLLIKGDRSWRPLREFKDTGFAKEEAQTVEHDEDSAPLVTEDTKDQGE